MSSRELQPNYDASDDPFYGLGYTPDEQATQLHSEHEQQHRQVYHAPVRPLKRSGNVRSTESDRDTIPEQQPDDGELPDRQRGFAMIDLHTRERIDHLKTAYEAVASATSQDAIMERAKIRKEIDKQEKRRREFGLVAYSSLFSDD